MCVLGFISDAHHLTVRSTRPATQTHRLAKRNKVAVVRVFVYFFVFPCGTMAGSVAPDAQQRIVSAALRTVPHWGGVVQGGMGSSLGKVDQVSARKNTAQQQQSANPRKG